MKDIKSVLIFGALILLLVPPLKQAAEHSGKMSETPAKTDPITIKQKAIGPLLGAIPKDASVGYITDFNEEGYQKGMSFYIARFASFPTLLVRFQPETRYVIADMKGPDGLEAFGRQWGYRVIRKSGDSMALMEKAP